MSLKGQVYHVLASKQDDFINWGRLAEVKRSENISTFISGFYNIWVSVFCPNKKVKKESKHYCERLDGSNCRDNLSLSDQYSLYKKKQQQTDLYSVLSKICSKRVELSNKSVTPTTASQKTVYVHRVCLSV